MAGNCRDDADRSSKLAGDAAELASDLGALRARAETTGTIRLVELNAIWRKSLRVRRQTRLATVNKRNLRELLGELWKWIGALTAFAGVVKALILLIRPSTGSRQRTLLPVFASG